MVSTHKENPSGPGWFTTNVTGQGKRLQLKLHKEVPAEQKENGYFYTLVEI